MAEPLVTFEQAQAVTEFAQALYAYDQFGFWSPMLSNQLLQSLNNNPETPSSDKIRKALAEYKENSEQIQGYMEYMKFWDMIFAYEAAVMLVCCRGGTMRVVWIPSSNLGLIKI